MKKYGFSAGQTIEALNTTARIFWLLLRSGFRASVLSVLLFVALIVLNAFTQLPLLESISIENYGAYDGFLIAVITIIGVFLTLYFTNLNTLVGTFYVEMPAKIRTLLIQEKVGNIYIGFLIFLTIFSLILLSAGTLNGFRPQVTVVLLALFSCLAVLTFAQLTHRSFSFFDPTLFAGILLADLHKSSNGATTRGYSWHIPSFQDFYRRQARSASNALASMSNVCHDRSHLRQAALGNLMAVISAFYVLYLPRKRCIPSDSLWYEQTPYNRRRYLYDYPSSALSMATQTVLDPEMKPDHQWLEKILMEIQIETLDRCNADGRIRVIHQTVSNLVNVFETFGKEWELEYALQSLSEILDVGILVENNSHTFTKHDETVMLAIADLLALLPISLLLGFMRDLDNFDLARLEEKISDLNWKSHKNIYDLGLPATTLYQLEYVLPRLQFEIAVEQRQVTPHWYLWQLVSQAISMSLQEQLNSLREVGDKFYHAQARALIARGQYMMTAQTLTRGFEFYNKVYHNLPVIHNLVETLEKSRILQEMKWPQWNLAEFEERVRNDEKALVLAAVDSIPALEKIPDSADVPDYFGQIVHRSGEEFFSALSENDTEYAAKLFRPYFFGVLVTHNRLLKETADWPVEHAIVRTSDPLIDLLELSGVAFILAEYHQNIYLREIVERAWDKYLSDDDESARLEGLLTTVRLARRAFAISPGSMMRTQWSQAVSHLVQDLPRIPCVFPTHAFAGSIPPTPSTVADHPSLLVRALAGDGIDNVVLGILDPMDIFIELFLLPRAPEKRLSYGANYTVEEMLKYQQEKEKDAEISFSPRSATGNSSNTSSSILTNDEDM